MFSKVFHLLKMTWMFSWRAIVLHAIFFPGRYNATVLVTVALIASGVLVFGFNKAIAVFPIFRLLGRRQVLIPADGSGERVERPPVQRKAPRKSESGNSQEMVDRLHKMQNLEYTHKATLNGQITGYEPSILDVLPLPKLPIMNGVPGAGLRNSTAEFEEEHVNMGVKGEENFAKALHKAQLLSRFHTIWSVPVPAQDRFAPGPYDTDIDCILATDKNIYLVDLKNYKSGQVRYYAEGNALFCEDIPTGKQVGEVKVMSRNMQMAIEAMRHHFPEAAITPVVVFMPTDKGEAVIDNVFWPGRIRAVNLRQFLFELSLENGFNWNLPHAGAFARMGNLRTMKKPKYENKED